MNLALNKNEPLSYSMRILLSMWRILKAVVYIAAGLMVLVVLMPIGKAIMKSGDPTGWLFFTAVFLSLISIIILAYSIKNDRFASVVISLSLLAFILISIFAVNVNEIRYTATALLALTQIQNDFSKRTVRYVIDDGELLRETPGGASKLITKMDGAELSARVEGKLVRLEWSRPGVERPGQRKGQRLLMLVLLKGAQL